MATVHIPAPMRSLTGGEVRVSVPGGTLREVIDALEAAHPGLRERLVQGEKVRPGLAVWIDGDLPLGGLGAKVREDSEVYFAPAIAGG